MAKQFTIDDAFSLEGEEEGAGPEEDLDGWKDRERERDGEMTFGPLTFSKPQSLPSSSTGTMDHSNLKYQVRIHSLLLFIYIFIISYVGKLLTCLSLIGFLSIVHAGENYSRIVFAGKNIFS